MKKRFRPLRDRVLVKADKVPQKIGGLSVPKGQEEEPNTGIVIAAGPKALLDSHNGVQNGRIIRQESGNPEGVRIGEQVQWRPYAGHDVSHLGTTHKLLMLDEIDGVLEDE